MDDTHDDMTEAAVALEEERFDDALACVRRLAVDPDEDEEDRDTWRNIVPVIEALAAGRAEEAYFRLVEEVETASDVDEELYGVVGEMLARDGKDALAALAFAEADRDDLTERAAGLRAKLGLDELLLAEKGAELTVEHYRRRVAHAPEDAAGWEALARALLVLDRQDEAREAAERAVALDPSQLWAWLSLADALARAERTSDALAKLDEAAKAFPDHAEPVLEKARLLEDPLGRHAEALAAYREALARAPGDDDAVAGIARVSPRVGIAGAPPPRPALPRTPSPIEQPRSAEVPGARLGWLLWVAFVAVVGGLFAWWSIRN